jgi:hypothetical protein
MLPVLPVRNVTCSPTTSAVMFGAAAFTTEDEFMKQRPPRTKSEVSIATLFSRVTSQPSAAVVLLANM